MRNTTPTANADGTYLPMPWTGARRIEGERREYQERQQLHHERFPNYAAGWRRPSETTVARVWELIGEPATQVAGDLSAIERQALVIALDAAIQAGEDRRLLTANLVFEAVAGAYSDWYRAARERGPARVSWEMAPDVLKSAWRDLRWNEIYLDKLMPAVRDGLGLYKVPNGRDAADADGDEHSDSRTVVKLTDRTKALRDQFLARISEDGATGGKYQRRSSLRRLRLAGESEADGVVVDEPQQDEDEVADFDIESAEASATTRKVVAGVAYNVATPGPRSLDVIRTLEGARLFLNAKAVDDEYFRLMGLARAACLEAEEKYGVDLTKSTTKTPRTVIDAGTGKPRPGFYRSAWQRHLIKVLGLLPDPAKLSAVVALGKKFDKFMGQAIQLEAVMKRLWEIERAGGLDEHGEVEICTRYAKLSNRRFQALDFWMTEVSGKDELDEDVYGVDPSEWPDDTSPPPIATRTRSRRSRLFRIGASRSREERAVDWLETDGEVGESGIDRFRDRQELVGVDVSGSQIQIYAVLLGLRNLEERLGTKSYKEIAALRAWELDQDRRNPFKLPDGYEGESDPRLKEAAKSATMTWLYDSKPNKIVERLAEDPDEFGAGLGTASNFLRFLQDSELQLDQVAFRWKPACREIAKRAWDEDAYAGIIFTDPFDGTPVRWNPVRSTLGRVAGADDVRIYAKVPRGVKNAGGDFPVYQHKLETTFGPCFIHTLDSLFCGLVIEELARLGVPALVAIHDAWYVAADAENALRAAVKAAGKPWFEALGGVYDDLERLLGTCTPRTRGPRKGKCCGHCANWIRELRGGWEHRMATNDWPEFNVGSVRPSPWS